MKKLIVFLLAVAYIITPCLTHAQTIPTQNYIKAKVMAILQDTVKDVNGKKNPFQQVKLLLLEGREKNKEITVEYGGATIITEHQKLSIGETVVLAEIKADNKTAYAITDRYRLPSLLIITLIFFGLVFLITGKKGIGSIAGLLISLAIIVGFIVPQILNGSNPLTVSIIGSFVIMIVTLYLAHGLNNKTTISVAATGISLLLTGILAIISVSITKLSGLGSEDAYNLLIGSGKAINLQGLLLGGIIIGALGVLDDTTTTQSATIAELAEANPRYSMRELFTRGMIIGKEHIASLVNTLVLAYAGAAMGIFIFIIITLQNNTQPWWVIFNSEILAEEIVRTLAGSIGLILAVPITTFLAAFFAKHEIRIK